MTCGLGEVAHLTWIDRDSRELGDKECRKDTALEPSCGFHDNERYLQGRQTRHEGAHGRIFVWDGPCLAAGKDVHVEGCFGNIDSNEGFSY